MKKGCVSNEAKSHLARWRENSSASPAASFARNECKRDLQSAHARKVQSSSRRRRMTESPAERGCRVKDVVLPSHAPQSCALATAPTRAQTTREPAATTRECARTPKARTELRGRREKRRATREKARGWVKAREKSVQRSRRTQAQSTHLGVEELVLQVPEWRTLLVRRRGSVVLCGGRVGRGGRVRRGGGFAGLCGGRGDLLDGLELVCGGNGGGERGDFGRHLFSDEKEGA